MPALYRPQTDLVVNSSGQYTLTVTIHTNQDEHIEKLTSDDAIPDGHVLRLFYAVKPGTSGNYPYEDDHVFMNPEGGLFEILTTTQKEPIYTFVSRDTSDKAEPSAT
jgi:hypothetical protein